MLVDLLLLPVNSVKKAGESSVQFIFLKITLSQGSPPTNACPGCSCDSLFLQTRPQLSCSSSGVPVWHCVWKSMYLAFVGMVCGRLPKNA